MQELMRPADLRDNSAFPAYEALPEKGLYGPTDGPSYPARKHWCFLAEIIHVENFVRLKVSVRDKFGHDTFVALYTPGRGGDPSPSLLKVGNTMAVLYPEQYMFLDTTMGIRLEDPKLVKIFPAPLKDLLALSDKVQRYATLHNGERDCQGCNKKATTLKKCARCNLFWYCDKACQTIGWNQQGHKADCKLLRDPDMRTLLLLEHEDSKQRLAFSVG